MMNRKERKTHKLLQRKTKKANRKSGLYIVRKCAENIPQKAKWDIPNGEMGHPKWQNGTSQMAKWDTPNGEMGHPKRQNGIPQMVKWDTPNGKMGYPKWSNGTSQMAKWDIIKGGLDIGGMDNEVE